jgi:ectoine hydroxylase-related dioxygenase (phytanoyl-CoA dioxygenase family)
MSHDWVELRARYENDGVVCVRQAFDASALSVMAEAIASGMANPGPMYLDYSKATRPGTYHTDLWVWRENPAMRSVIFETPAAELAGRAMGVDSVMLVTDNWMVRGAGAVNRAPWHHDAPYFDVEGRWCVLWTGLEPVGRGEGVVFLPGSHRWGRRFIPEAFDGSGAKVALAPGYEPTPDFGEEPALLEFALEPGDCLIFDCRTVHGAPNPEPASRTVRRMTLRFAEGGARFVPQGPWTADQVAFLEAAGHRTGGPLVGPLLPLLWTAQDGRLPAPNTERSLP